MDEPGIEAAFARGRQVWTRVDIDLSVFREHLGSVLSDEPQWDWKRYGDELFLTCACARGDAEAVRVLETDILPQVMKAVARIDPDQEFVEEALQILRVKLLVGPRSKIASYAARGPLVAWLSVAAARVALDLVRARNARERLHADLRDRPAQTDESPLSDSVESRYEASFHRALKDAISALPSRERNLLRLQLVGNCSIDQLARYYLVHRATAARWLQRARDRIFEHVKAQMELEFGANWQEGRRGGTYESAMLHAYSTCDRLDDAIDWTTSEPESDASPSVPPEPEPLLEQGDIKGEERIAEHLSRHGSKHIGPEGGAVFRAGDVIGNRYVVERFLGRGAMGEVYLALDGDLQHTVALKTPAAEVSDRVEYEQRLKREVSLARRIVHSNVCRVHDVNTHAFAEEWRAPVTYLTMEYLEGEPLAVRVRRSPLSAAEARAVGRQVLGALGAIHKAGILHRDLKSGNIMLCPDGSEQRAVVMDFGLAVSIQAAVSGTNPTLGFVGTPIYASPEQLLGTTLTPASDLYSLGVVLFESLAGRLPFASQAELRLAAANRRLETLEWPETDARLKRFIEKCLQPDSAARFQSAQDALRALEEAPTVRPSRTRGGRTRAARRRGYEPYPVALIDEIDRLTVELHRREARDDDIAAEIRALVGRAGRHEPPRVGDVLLGVEVVGTGAFGDVWRASAEGGGEIAIKVFHANKLGLSLALHQFRRGLRAMRQLEAAPGRPDSVIRLLASDPSQTVFSMPFADKLDLSSALKPWPLENKLGLFREVCRAVQFAHREGVIHRDIKPGNILITRDTRPVLADFDSCDFMHIRTMSALQGGTVLFAAPEQFDGSASRDVRSDVYSLGRLLHYLLLERTPPFRVDNEPALEDLQNQPAPLVQLIRRCTMRELSRRWSNVEALLGELELCLAPATLPVPARSSPATHGSITAAPRGNGVRRAFISYVREDGGRAKALVARLEAAGVPAWLDELQLEVGQRWQEEIRAAIRSAALFVALFSRDGSARERSFMREELALAVDELRLRPRDRPWFIPVMLDDVPLPDLAIGPSERLDQLQVARLHETGEAGVDRLIDTLRKHLR